MIPIPTIDSFFIWFHQIRLCLAAFTVAHCLQRFRRKDLDSFDQRIKEFLAVGLLVDEMQICTQLSWP